MQFAANQSFGAWGRGLLLTVAVTLLFAVWPVAHTVMLRYTLLCVLLLASLQGIGQARFKQPFWHLATLLVVLTVWLTFGAFRSPYAAYSLAELGNQWLKAVLIFFLGALLAHRGIASQLKQRLPLAILLGLSILPLGTLAVDVLPVLVKQGHFDYGSYALTLNNKTNISYAINTALALIVTELIYRICGKKRLVPLHSGALAALTLALLLCSFCVGARNGIVGLVFLSVSASLLILIDLKQKVGMVRLAAVALMLAATLALSVGYAYKADPRWSTLGETVSIALDTDHYKAWTVPTFDFPGKYPMPKLANGTPVADSNYQRIAWMKEGLLLVKDYPLGLGFGRDVFGWGLHIKYQLGTATPGKVSVPHGVPINGHSSLIEFSIGAGVVGTVLLLAFFGYIVVYGFRAYYRRRDPYGLILAFLTTGFLGRMLIDSNLRDHTFQELMFLIGFYLVLSLDFTRDRPEHAQAQDRSNTMLGK